MTLCITRMQLLLKVIHCLAESLGVEISARNIDEYDTLVRYGTIVANLCAADPAGTVVKECQRIFDLHGVSLIVFRKDMFINYYS